MKPSSETVNTTDKSEVSVLPAPDDPGGHRAERGRRLRLSLLTAIVTRPLAILIPLVSVPVFLQYLGREGYGLFESITALAAWLTLTNLGLSLGLVNELTSCYVSADRGRAQQCVSSLLVAIVGLLALAAIVITLVVPRIEWQRIFPTADPAIAAQAPFAIWVAAMVTLLGVAVGSTAAIYTAHQELHRNNLWDGAAKLATIIACLIVPLTPLGLVGPVLAIAGVPAFVRLVNLIYLFGWEKRWLRPRLGALSWPLMRSMTGQGIALFILQMAVILVFEGNKLVISFQLGTGAVTDYSVAGRLFLIAYGIYMLLLAPLWPAYGEALRRGDRAWVRRGVRMSTALGLGSVGACGMILFFFSDTVLGVWLPEDRVHVSRELIVAMTAMFAVRAWVDSRSVILNSSGILRPQIASFGAHALLNVVLAVVLAKPFGIVGVAWSTVITSLITNAWAYPWMLRRYVWRNDTTMENGRPPVLP